MPEAGRYHVMGDCEGLTSKPLVHYVLRSDMFGLTCTKGTCTAELEKQVKCTREVGALQAGRQTLADTREQHLSTVVFHLMSKLSNRLGKD